MKALEDHRVDLVEALAVAEEVEDLDQQLKHHYKELQLIQVLHRRNRLQQLLKHQDPRPKK